MFNAMNSDQEGEEEGREGEGGASSGQLLQQVREALAEDRLVDAAQWADQVFAHEGANGEATAIRADAGYLACMAAYRLGRWVALLERAQPTLTLLEQQGDVERQVEVGRWLTLSAVETGRFDLALKCAHESYRLAQGTDNRASIGLSLVALASCIERIGDPWQAYRLMEEARTTVQSVDDPYTHCVILNNLCAAYIGVYYLLRDTAQAQELAEVIGAAERHAREAMQWLDRFPHNSFVSAIVEGNLGETLVHRGQLDEARQHLERALGRVAKANNLARSWRIRYSLAELALAQGRVLDARDALVSLRTEMAASEQTNTLTRVHDSLYRAWRAIGDEAQALKALEAFMALERKRVISQLRAQSQLFVTRVETESARRELLAERHRAAQLEVDAQRDPLTGLYNRRYLEAGGRTLVHDCAAEGRPIAVALIDLDHFKDVNDRLGHPVGDVVLARAARVLGAGLRSTDRLLRFGGEEFLILLPDASLAAASEVCERLRAAVQAQPWDEIDPSMSLTVSIGLTAAPPYELDSMIAAADKALYRAKAGGRNRVSA